MSESNFKSLFTWRSAICDSDLPPTARHVALTLSLHMNERGGSCFPSLDTQAAETGLHADTVKKNLKVLSDRGWIDKEIDRTMKGRGTKVMYSATFPTTGAESTGAQNTGAQNTGVQNGGPQGFSTPTTGAENPLPLEGDKRATKRASVSSRTSSTLVSDGPLDLFDRFWETYGNLAGTGKKKAREGWDLALKRGNDPDEIIAGLAAWVVYWRTPGANKAMYAQGFLNQEKYATAPPPLQPEERKSTPGMARIKERRSLLKELES
jgi:hypothetical protein